MQDAYLKELDNMFLNYAVELIIYDESEYFQDWDSKDFNNPFMKRKSVLKSFKISPDYVSKINTEGYEMSSMNIKL